MEVKGKAQDNLVFPPTEDHIYELADFGSTANCAKNDLQRAESLKEVPKRSAWNTPFIVLVVLLCIILMLLLVILCVMLFRTPEQNVRATTADANINNPPKFENAEIILEMMVQAISNITELFDLAIENFNNSIVQSLPDFNKWANGIASRVTSNVTGNLPVFNEWANGVVSKVNQNLPDFNEWADGVASKVNRNVTGSLPDFNEWANGVVSKVNQSLPDFNEWADGVASKVNRNVTGNLPEFDEWANGVVTKVNSNVTGSLPDFNGWANNVAQNTRELLHSNFTELDEQILHTTNVVAEKLNKIINVLSNLHDTSTSTAGVVNEILLVAQELLALHNESADSAPLPTSCEELKSQYPSSLSGYYVLTTDNETYTTYCNMEELCGSGGGWTRLAYLDMNDAAEDCPSGFRLYQSGGVRACGRANYGCVSVSFPSQNLSYSQICGRVKGYQYGTTDAIKPQNYYWYSYNIRNNINTYYVDGVSITRGSPRQHVWTLMSGYAQDSSSSSSCPCNAGNSVPVLSFIGNNYFCESGSYGYPSVTLHTNDTLWDGQGCFSNEAPCCNVPGIPWFHRDYGTTTTDYIELRVCGNESPSNEDAPVSYYEIYVK